MATGPIPRAHATRISRTFRPATTPIPAILVFDFTILRPDFNRDNQVQFDDFVVLADMFGGADGFLFVDGDVEGNGDVQFADFVALSDDFGLNFIDASCSCQQSATSGGSGLTTGVARAVDQRETVLQSFRQLANDGASREVLAMGMYLLDILWAQAGEQDEWLQVEHDLLAEIDGLARAAHDLDLRLESDRGARTR